MKYMIDNNLYEHSKSILWGKELTCSLGNSNICIVIINASVFIIWIPSNYDISVLGIRSDKIPYLFNKTGSSYPVSINDPEQVKYSFLRINSNTIKIESANNSSIKIFY